jgi:transcriptional regulator with XRE-family HTH domain
MKASKLLAWNLRRLRVARKLSQENLAVDADVDTSYISRLENGLENPSLATVERLARALGATFTDMFKPPRNIDRPPAPLSPGRRKRS